jgi:hypothetical protein
VADLQTIKFTFFYYEMRNDCKFGWIPVQYPGFIFRKERLQKEKAKKKKKEKNGQDTELVQTKREAKISSKFSPEVCFKVFLDTNLLDQSWIPCDCQI